MDWYLAVLKKYAVFHGRARRQEYWMFVLFNFIFSIVAGFVDGLLGSVALGVIYSLAIFIPSLAVSVRRLHDTGRSGWWLLIGLVPLLGMIILLIFAALEGDEASNEYGDNPKTSYV